MWIKHIYIIILYELSSKLERDDPHREKKEKNANIATKHYIPVFENTNIITHMCYPTL